MDPVLLDALQMPESFDECCLKNAGDGGREEESVGDF
jgi:hypothetical protein